MSGIDDIAEADDFDSVVAVIQSNHPVDPAQLLKALGPLLAQNGSIRGPIEAARIASLMKDANKIVSRCIYVNILKATQSSDTLERFMSVGGWDTLNAWLQESKDDENWPVLVEILKVYQNLPVSVDILKKNNAAKTIKQLCKSDNDNVKSVSAGIVDGWMKKIRQKSNNDITPSNDKIKKKKKDKEKDKAKEKNKNKDHKHHSNKNYKSEKEEQRKEDNEDGDENEEEETDTSESSHTEIVTVTQSEGLKLHIKLGRTDKTDSSKGDNSSSGFADLNDKLEPEKKRASTVKRPPVKFRSTGLIDDEGSAPVPPAPVKKKSQSENKPVPKRTGSETKTSTEPPEKKSRLHVNIPNLTISSTPTPNTAPTSPSPSPSPSPSLSPGELHGRIKIIPPRPRPVHEIQESSGFMDSLARSDRMYGTMKKRKKGGTTPPVSAFNTITTPTKPTSPTLPISPTTATAKSLPSVPSFYKDTMETSEESSEVKKEEKEESSAQGEPIETTEEKSEDLAKSETTEGEEGEKVTETEQDDEETSEDAKEEGVDSKGSETKGLLTTGATRRKKPKKKVSWAEESRMEEVFYFELDETERENVNRPKDFDQMKKRDILMDRRAMESAKRQVNDKMVETIPWYKPFAIAAIRQVVEPGCQSLEKDIQRTREQGVLQVLFFSKIPDSPAEPDLEHVEPAEPKIIALEDTTGEEEYTYDYNEHPGPNLCNPPLNQSSIPANAGGYNLPPEIANLLSSIQQHGPPDTTNPVLASVQNILTSLMGGSSEQESREAYNQLQRMLEPFNQQMLGPPMQEGGMPPRGPGPMGHGGPVGLLGQAPPGFHPIRNMGPRFPPNGPGPGPGPGPRMGPGPGDEGWGENMMGGPRPGHMGPGRGGPPRQAFRGRMPGPGPRGPPLRGRGGFRQGIICRHFAAGDCKRGNACGFLHPGVNGPPMGANGPPHPRMNGPRMERPPRMDGPPPRMDGPPNPR